MLKKTPMPALYLTAAELGITDREREGLIEVRNDLASGRVRHVENPHPSVFGDDDANACLFSMNWFRSSTDCGTAHCIGGFVRARGIIHRSEATRSLYVPSDECAYNQGPEVAVRAIDRFLCGDGAECWPNALADEQ